jgi:hypothetical protein
MINVIVDEPEFVPNLFCSVTSRKVELGIVFCIGPARLDAYNQYYQI